MPVLRPDGHCRKARFKSILARRVPRPSCCEIFTAWSMVVYLRVTDYGSMKSLMLRPSGAERCVITRNEPSCFGTTPSPEQWNGEKGAEAKGPAMRPARHSLRRYSVTTSGWAAADGTLGARMSLLGP